MESRMQMIKILWSIHNSAWLLIWMDMLFDRRKYIDSDKKFILTIFLSGMLWYGLQKYLSWIPLLLLLTILGYLLWNGSVEKVASLVVSYVFIWTVLLGLVEHFLTNAEFCAQTGWLILNSILISAIRHKGIGKTFTALNLLKTFGIAFFSTAFLCDFFMDMIYGNAIQNYVFLSCLVSLLLMVCFCFRQSQLKMQISVLDTQYDLIESQYVRAQNFYAENAKLYHDIKHHLRALERLLQNGDQREALAYIESVQEPLQCKMIPVHTGVDIVDTVIYEAKEKAEQRNILLQVETPILPSELKIEDRELCVLCANLLDNALKAAKEQIKLNIAIAAGFLVIEMENDYKEKPLVKNNHFVSETEQGSLAHGWGMKIIEQIVEKYHGELTIRVDVQVSIKMLLDVL
ncbi:GHKL domain-containing protein [Waltera sp.]|uniref:sensor histidine kinase n=1 Tax=Waltera sp. TaxID=2815806 RepID=UPI00307832D9